MEFVGVKDTPVQFALIKHHDAFATNAFESSRVLSELRVERLGLDPLTLQVSKLL